MAWLVQHIPVSTATLAAIFGAGLQEQVWRDLADRGPATVHDLSQRLGVEHERTRNALYRLASVGAVGCYTREASPVGGTIARVVWCARDHDGRPVGTAQGAQQPGRALAGAFAGTSE